MAAKIRDDVSQRSALRSNFAKKPQGVNFQEIATPNMNKAKSAAIQRTSQIIGNNMKFNRQATEMLSVVPEIVTPEVTAQIRQMENKGKEYQQLNLGNHYTVLQDTIKQRLDILRENITKPRNSEKKAKR